MLKKVNLATVATVAVATVFVSSAVMAQDLADVASAAMDAIREARMKNAASSDVKAIFSKAIDAEEDGNINFCGFFTGMSKDDAQKLADFYKLKPGEWSVMTPLSSSEVCELWFSLRSVRKLTKGGGSFDELAQAVANRIGTLEREDVSGGKEWWRYTTTEGVEAIMSEQIVREAEIKLIYNNRSVNAGLTIYDKAKASRAKAGRERQAAEQVQSQIAENAKSAIRELEGNMVPIPNRGYAICKYEVTQALWLAVMGDNPSKYKGANRPVESVRFSQIEEFIGKLNEMPEVRDKGHRYRLPTMDEWEYACRAGGEGDYCKCSDGKEISADSLGDVAWWGRESWEGGSTHPVGQKMPNAFGLYDMLGNVWEWVIGSNGKSDTIRGGAYDQHRDECTATIPDGLTVNCGKHSVSDDLGFRLAR